MASFGQWQKSQQTPKSGFASFIAKDRETRSSRLKELETEAAALKERQEVVDSSTWAPVTQGLKARQQEHIGSLVEVAASLGDENAYDVAGRDFNANDRAAMARRQRQQALAAEKGVTLNRANQQFFDDEGVTPEILDARAAALRKVIEAGRQPGESRLVIKNAQEDLALLREQRRRIAKTGSVPESKRQETPQQDKLGLHSLGQAYRAEAQKIRERVAPLEAERGEGMIPSADYIAEKALQTVPDAVIGLGGTVLGGPAAGALMMGGVVAPPAFAERKWAGADNATAAAGAALTAGSEVVGEAIGGTALRGLKLASPIARAGTAIAGDVAGEMVTEALNIGTEITLDGKKVTVDEGIKRLIDTGLITAVSSGAASGGIAYVSKPESTQSKPPETPATPSIDPVSEPIAEPVVQPESPVEQPYIPSQEDIDYDERATEEYARATVAAEAAAKKVEQLRKKAEVAVAVAQETGSPVAVERATKAQTEYEAARAEAAALDEVALGSAVNVDSDAVEAAKAEVKAQQAREAAMAKEREALAKQEAKLAEQEAKRAQAETKQAEQAAAVQQEAEKRTARQSSIAAAERSAARAKISAEQAKADADIAANAAVNNPGNADYQRLSKISQATAIRRQKAAEAAARRLDIAKSLYTPTSEQNVQTIDPETALETAETQPIEPVAIKPIEPLFEKGFDPYAQDDEMVSLPRNTPTTLPRDAPRDEKIAEFRRNKGLEYSRTEPTYAEALTELAGREGAFSAPIPQGNTLPEIVKSAIPDSEPFDLDFGDGVKATVVPFPNGAAKIFESSDKIWIDVSELKPGEGGQQIYQAAAARANAVKKKFVPDPLGVTPLAMTKRPENLLSAGLKHGNFEFLEPGDHIQNYQGERNQKADALADQNLKTVVAAYPEIADIVTDGEQFVNAKTGEVFSDDAFDRIAARKPLPDVLGGYRAGSKTLKRAAFLNTFSPGRRGTFGVAALEKLRQRAGNTLPKSLQRFLYSRGTDKVDGITRARAERTVDKAMGAGTFARAIKSGKVKLHSAPDAIGADANAAAAYEAETDTIHLFANNLEEATIAGKFLHEFTHRGFQAAVGGAKNEAEVFARLRELADNGDVDAKNAYKAASGEANVDREALAYFIEHRENKPVPKSLFDSLASGIRKALGVIGIRLKESDSNFKRRIYDIARKSLRAQVQAEAKRQEGTRELNESVENIDFSGLEKNQSAFTKESIKTLMDTNFVFEEVNKLIEEAGGTVTDSTNIAMRMNMSGSALGEVNDKVNRLQKEFEEQAIKSKLSLEDIGVWSALQDRDAYDAEVFERTGERNASGLTDAEAATERARLEPKAKELQELTDMITAIHQMAADVKKNAGLITAEERAKRRKTYVALRGHDSSERSESAVPGIYGKSITGKEYKTENARQGRPNYRDIPGHAFEDLTKAHVRAAWNKVVRTMMAFAVKHPNSGIFEFEPAKFDADGKPVGGVDDRIIYGKIKGKTYKLVIKHPSAARAIMRSVGAPSQTLQILQMPNKLMSYALTTGLSFAGKQFTIDNIEAFVTAKAEQGLKVATDMLTFEPKSIASLWRYVQGRPDLNNPIDKNLQEFAKLGGITSFTRDRPASRITRELSARIEPTGITKASIDEIKALWGAVFKKDYQGKTVSEATAQLRDVAGQAPGIKLLSDIAEQVERANKVIENGVRFAFYLSMRKNKPDVSAERAAYLAKELTVNFDRRGEWANALGALIIFYKPIAQSARKTWRLFKNKNFWKMAAPAIGAAFALGLSNASFEDEEGNLAIDNVPDYERATGLIIMYGGGPGEYVRIPLPPGLISIVNQYGQGAATVAAHARRGDKERIKRQLLDIGAGTYEAVAPALEADGSISMGAPGIFWHLARNQNQYGSPIYPKSFDEGMPRSEQTRGNAGVAAQFAADALNYKKWQNAGLKLVGSSWQWDDEVPMGYADWSPEQINYLVGAFMPAINKEIMGTWEYGKNWLNRNEALGSEYATNKAISEIGTLPVLKAFVGKPSSQDSRYRDDFARQSNEIDKEERQLKKIRAEGGDEAAFLEQSKTMQESRVTGRGVESRGDDQRGRINRAEREMSALNKVLKKWYNAKELNDELIESVQGEIDISDIRTAKLGAYRSVVIDRLREKISKIRRESLR